MDTRVAIVVAKWINTERKGNNSTIFELDSKADSDTGKNTLFASISI